MDETVTEPVSTGRKKQLNKLLSQGCPLQEKQLMSLLEEYHDVFSLEEVERVEINIDTGDATPIRQAPCHTTFAVHCEVAQRLQQLQESGVFQPSGQVPLC